MDVSAIASSLQVSRASATAKSGATDPVASAGSSGASAADAASVSAQPTGLYISPVLRYDQGARLAVLYFRDFDTGETRDQIPAERVVEQYRRSGGVKGDESSSADPGSGETSSDVSLGESFLSSSADTTGTSSFGSGTPAGGSSSYAAAATTAPATGTGGYGAGGGALVSVTV